MDWGISIAAEGWQQIRDELEKWDEKRLIDAICDDKFEAVLDKAGHHHAGRAAYWIDREGDHKVFLLDERDEG